MASKTLTKSKKSKREEDRVYLSARLARSMREVGLFAAIGFVAYFFITLLTYSPSDPGPFSTGSGAAVQNLGGKSGAWIADLLFSLFGRMSYFLLILALLFIWRLWSGHRSARDAEQKQTTKKNGAEPASMTEQGWVFGLVVFIGFAFAMVGACSLEHIYFPIHNSLLTSGGALGSYFGSGFRDALGVIGSTILALALFFLGVTLVSQISWLNLMDRVGFAVFVIFEKGRAAIETFRDRRKGTQLRKERTESVAEIRQVIKEKKPPMITPRKEPVKPEVVELKKPPVQSSVFAKASVGGTLPSMDLLEMPEAALGGYSEQELASFSDLLIKKLKDFNVDVTVEAVQPGPVITRFELEPAPGVKASQIVGLSKDLARSLSVVSIRVVENIPGKSVIGIEIPNENREVVKLVEGLSSSEYTESKSPLTIVLGKDIAGETVVADLMKMPHVLIAGTTGSGKSVCINALILSLVYKSTPKELRMIMVDPKFLELSVYDGIPHLLTPVVTDMNKAANALRWCIGEMDRRFRIMAGVAVRNIASYNKKIDAANKSGQPIPNPMHDPNSGEPEDYLEHMPLIVVIVDELADLVMVVGKKVEEIIIRIAQRARAAGIHLVLATQRPSVDVVTGLIKANVPTRIAFQVSSRSDSRTVLDQMGAEQLLGQGDMLFLPPGSAFTQRVHGAFVSDQEVNSVVKELKSLGEPEYISSVIETEGASEGGSYSEGDGEGDPLYDDAVEFVTRSRKASISAVQRALRVGYNRAARMVETMEAAGVISAADNGKREVLAPPPPEE